MASAVQPGRPPRRGARRPAVRRRALRPPVGKLTPRGCTLGTGTAACDLYAMAGTTASSDPGADLGVLVDRRRRHRRPHPVRCSSSTRAIRSHHAAQPGRRGDRLARAARAGRAFPAGGDDTAGVANGGTRTYTFTAARPGTFLYEAGHTSGGARQVAMGLAGALVVLPADGTAYGTQPATGHHVRRRRRPGAERDRSGAQRESGHFDMRRFARSTG